MHPHPFQSCQNAGERPRKAFDDVGRDRQGERLQSARIDVGVDHQAGDLRRRSFDHVREQRSAVQLPQELVAAAHPPAEFSRQQHAEHRTRLIRHR